MIADLDVRINYAYLLKSNIPNDYWRKDKLESGLLYTSVIGDLLEMYLPINDNNLVVFCDQRHLKRIKRKEFKKIIKTRLSPNVSTKTNIQIEMLDSTTSANIQIADWIVGAIAWYLEEKESGEDFFQVLKNNFLSKKGKELFRSHWEEKIEKQKNQS